jgi:hypothetical protein
MARLLVGDEEASRAVCPKAITCEVMLEKRAVAALAAAH